MKTLFVDCPTGIAGDMLLAALFDLGVPLEVVKSPLARIGLEKAFDLRIEQSQSYGLRGKKVFVESLEEQKVLRNWKNIKLIVKDSPWNQSLKNQVFAVFKVLAEAEAAVHGIDVENVHFHELGAIDSLVDVVGVCAAVEYLNPKLVLCSNPPAGHGIVETAHGLLPVPVPAVLELAKRHEITLQGGDNYPKGELTTPTGLALMAVLSESFGQPNSFNVFGIGVGIGHKKLDRPNLLRVLELDEQLKLNTSQPKNQVYWQFIVVQEAWVDDANPEDMALFIDMLKSEGAVEVVCESCLMKKGRQGVRISAIVPTDKAVQIRSLWFNMGTTIGLRERIEGRWLLPRRKGFCQTSLGKLRVKQVMRPNGQFTIKFEHDELSRISLDSGKSLDQIRQEIFSSLEEFIPEEDWSF